MEADCGDADEGADDEGALVRGFTCVKGASEGVEPVVERPEFGGVRETCRRERFAELSLE